MLFSFFISNLLWTEGIYIILCLVALIFVGWLFWKPLAYSALFMLFFSFYFFRNPDRVCPKKALKGDFLVSPADGTVVEIVNILPSNPNGFTQRVSIFLSPFDVHVNRSPYNALVQNVTYVPGRFLMAFLPKSSAFNEHNDLLFVDQKGRKIMVRQIAGILARRISCWAKAGEMLSCGQPFGMIRFGSRVDIFLPPSVHITVNLQQAVYGGETILGYWV